VQENPSFKRSTMDEVFSRIVHQSSFKDQLDEAQTQDWIVTMSRRFRNLLRHSQQGRVKRVSWIIELFGASADAPQEKVKEEADRMQKEECAFGYDWDLGVGWKAIHGRRVATSDRFFMADGHHDDDDNMWVRFPSGEDAEMAGFLVRDHAARQAPSKHRWCGEVDGQRVLVRERADRTPLMAVFVGKRQVCNLRVNAVPSKDIAFEVMQKIGQALADKKITAAQCYTLREELLSVLGSDTVASANAPSAARRLACKRPAAALFMTIGKGEQEQQDDVMAEERCIAKKPAATEGQYEGEFEGELDEKLDKQPTEKFEDIDMKRDDFVSGDAIRAMVLNETCDETLELEEEPLPGKGIAFFDNIDDGPCGIFDSVDF
jgi:hypothetical protein